MAQQRVLGRSGISVFPIGLGGMPMSIRRPDGSDRPDEARSLATLREAFELGVDFIDTADVYCLDDSDIGHNERLIARAIREFQARVLVATKGGLTRPEGRWERDASPAHLQEACERSLKALGVECIALYQLHAPDERVPLEDSVGALAELQRAGKIAHIGLSNVSVPQIQLAQRIAPIVSVQNRCNPHDRRAFDEGVVRYCEEQGIAFLAYSPVGGGRGVQRLREDPVLGAIGQRHGASAPQVALAWLLAKSQAIVPIPGASRPESIRSSVAAAGLSLTSEEMAELDSAFPT